MRKHLLASTAVLALLLAAPLAMAQSITFGAGTTSAGSGGVTGANSQNGSGAALFGITGSAVTQNAASAGLAGGQNTTGPGSNTSIAEHTQASATSGTSGAFALGLAASGTNGIAGAGGTSVGQAQGGYFTIVVAP